MTKKKPNKYDKNACRCARRERSPASCNSDRHTEYLFINRAERNVEWQSNPRYTKQSKRRHCTTAGAEMGNVTKV